MHAVENLVPSLSFVRDHESAPLIATHLPACQADFQDLVSQILQRVDPKPVNGQVIQGVTSMAR